MSDANSPHPHPLISKHQLEAEYPFRSQTLNLKEGRIHYLDEGQGQPLLFVHGNPTWSFAWRNLIKRFSSSYRCIAIDHLGCGLSDKPQQGDYSLAAHLHRLQQLIEQLELQKITLIAHDWGGAIGSGVAGRLPDRFHRLVLMNTAAFRSQRIPLRIAACRIPLLGTVGIRGLNLFARMAIMMAVSQQALSPAAKRGFLAPYNNWQNRIAIDRFVKDIPMQPSHPSHQTLLEIEENLKHLNNKPLLLPWGMKDWCFTPHFLKEFQQRFPSAATKTFPQAGHYLFEEESNGLGDVITEFLES